MKKLILPLLLLSFNLHAQSLTERLNVDITSLEAKMTTAPDKLKLDGREEAFRLQAYGRLFENKYKSLKKIKDKSKELEDQIGQCKKWFDLLMTTTTPAKKPLYKKNLDAESAKLNSLLAEWNENRTFEDFKNISNDIRMDEAETVKLAGKNMSQEIKNLIDKKFDFSYGETGLHELRRQIRWPKIYIQLFSDKIFIKKTTKCSVSPNDLYTVGALKNKVVFKGTPELESTIVLKDCAYVKLLGAVEVLGAIKDELEQAEVLDDKLPKEIKVKVVAIYKELILDVLPKLD